MRIPVLAMCAILVLTVLGAAQDHPKAELFGGYSLERIPPCGQSGSGCNFESNVGPITTSFSGWNASVTGYISKSWGITGDIAGHYGSAGLQNTGSSERASSYTYLFGPTFAIRREQASFFLDGLFGGASWSSQNNLISYTGLAWAVGGGVDINATEHLAFRPVQFDYVGTRVTMGNASLASGFRYSVGLVYKF